MTKSSFTGCPKCNSFSAFKPKYCSGNSVVFGPSNTEYITKTNRCFKLYNPANLTEEEHLHYYCCNCEYEVGIVPCFDT